MIRIFDDAHTVEADAEMKYAFPDSACPVRTPARVTFEPAGALKQTFASNF
jgi:hypothetical protein